MKREYWTLLGVLAGVGIQTGIAYAWYQDPATGFVVGCFSMVTWGIYRHKEAEVQGEEEPEP